MAGREARYASPLVISKAELLKAAAENRTELLLRYLNEGGGLDEARNDERQSLLHVAAMEGAEDCVTLLLQSPKVIRRINSRDRASRTALHLASAMGYDGCAQRLLEASATLDLQDEKGCTPLHLAVKFEWPETARVLLDAGADPLLEDIHGFNAVDMANDKGDGDAASLIASFARRRQPSALGQLKRCLVPNFLFGSSRPHADPAPLGGSSPMAEPRGSLPPPSMVGSQRLQSPERAPPERRHAARGEDGYPPEQSPAAAAAAFPASLSPAPAAAPPPSQEEIEWQGLEPVVVQRAPPAGGASAPSADAAAPASPSPLAAALEAGAGAAIAAGQSAAGPPSRGRGAVQALDDPAQEQDPEGSGRASSAPPARDPPSPSSVNGQAAPASESEACEDEEFAMFRLHAFFEEGVKRLEFEVEWKEGQPSVGTVKPKGEAARRGIISGDRLVEIAGAKTTGKGREELLPLLKTRPLLLKIDREERVLDPQEPHLEFELRLRGEDDEDTGLEVNFRGQLPVAVAVRPGSVAWRSGFLEGDAIFRLDSKDATKESKSALQAAVDGRPKTVTVWRRPQGVELGAPWHIRASAVGGS
uniref:PDZ domain-containing protein n=2 Tax=Alexandrium monilatum TaxID=311494 RepID=A0A7S4PYD4_9DINO